MKKKFMAGLLAMVFVFSVFTLNGCNSNKIVIGSKDFNESIVLGEIFAQLIEVKTEIKVERKLNLGGTFVCFEAMQKGNIDLYPEYTGTGIASHLKMNVISDPDECYDVCKEEFNKQFDISWLKPFGFNNTYAIAVTSEVATTYNLTKCSDLSKIVDGKKVAEYLKFGAEHEFYGREDGFENFCKIYGLVFKGEPEKMMVALKYKAMGENKMDIMMHLQQMLK
jgi:osmoprotectant transport system substrate-binding protein